MTAALATTGPSAYWYLSRGTGAVSLILLTLSVVLGVLGPLRFSAPRWPRFTIDALHRDVSLLVLAVLVLHIVTSVLDSFAPIKLIDAVLPLGSSYRPLWMGLGALAFDLLIALVLTSLLRRRLGHRAWRAIHWLAYASWPVAVLHGLGTGTDAQQGWMLVLTTACVAAVLIAVWTRIARAAPESAPLRGPALALSIAAPLGIAIFTLAGPLQRGWARRAGTPAALLRKTSAPAASAASAQRSSAPASAAAPRGPFSARLAGTITQTDQSGGAIVDMALRLTGGLAGRLRIRLAGAPIAGGGLSLTGSQVDLAPTHLPAVLEGRIVALQGQQFLARVAAASGPAFDLRARLSIDNQAGTVTGTLSGTPAGSGG
jgi:sulfoxide reductase heme-binding subunit YedZ